LTKYLELSPEYPVVICRCGQERLIMLSEFLWEGKDALEAYTKDMTVTQVLDLFLEGVSYTPDSAVFMGLFGELKTADLPEGMTGRKLRPILDQGALSSLKKSCTQKEAAAGSVSLEDVWPYGIFSGRKLACAASVWLWGDRLADLGVITRPEFRGKGLGRAAVAQVAQTAIDAGRLPLYRCEDTNPASRALARSLGFEAFAFEEGAVVHYPEEEE